VSAPNSMKLLGSATTTATMEKHFTHTLNTIGYEVSMQADANTAAGQSIGSIGFWSADLSKRFAVVYFVGDGYIYSGPNHTDAPWIQLQSFDANTWYKIKIIFNLNDATYDIWINDVQVAADFAVNPAQLDQLDAVVLESGVSGVNVYFDDLTVTEGTPLYITPENPAGSILTTVACLAAVFAAYKTLAIPQKIKKNRK
jgi:hypothetical protein